MKATPSKSQTGKAANQGMDWSAISGRTADFERQVREHWKDLTDDDVKMLEGNRDKLIERIEQRYHVTRAAAEKQVSDWATKLSSGAKSVADDVRRGIHKA